MIDLHTHSLHSDGTTTPEENVALAAAEGLAGMALTDHDTLAGWEPAAHACERAGMRFVPGLELSCEWNGLSVHLLGYWVDPGDQALLAECERLRGERERRAREILGLLAHHGVEIAFEDVRRRAGAAPIGRPHIAAAMVEAGAVPDIDTAFDRWLADGGPAYARKRALAPVDGVRLIREAGGVAVLAHPGLSSNVTPELAAALAAAGLAGIEAEHAAHEPEQVGRWTAVAARHGLVVTGASDFHGERKDVRIGQAATPVARVERLRAHCPQARPV